MLVIPRTSWQSSTVKMSTIGIADPIPVTARYPIPNMTLQTRRRQPHVGAEHLAELSITRPPRWCRHTVDELCGEAICTQEGLTHTVINRKCQDVLMQPPLSHLLPLLRQRTLHPCHTIPSCLRRR